MTPPFNHPRKIVKPHTCRHKHHPVIAVSGQNALTEQGELMSIDDLAARLPTMDPTLFAKQSAADWVSVLDRVFANLTPALWQWRATVGERDICNADGELVASRVHVLIHYFGWKGGAFHKIIDPVAMYGKRLDELWPDDKPSLTKLLDWAVCVRDFCERSNMEIRPTIGGIASQFLTDRRFYPNARRKVPATTNERAREALPGNHYILNAHPTPHREFTAHYLDQHRAHHYHARTTPLPNADSLYAYGHFRNLSKYDGHDTDPDFMGLYCLDLESPPSRKPSHWQQKLDHAFVFSNELQHLLDDGYKVKGVYAAWGSFQRDTGLAKYAAWAETQLDEHGDAAWLKPLLLATYGTLATRPKVGEAVFKLAKKGEPVRIRTGHRRLDGKMVKGTKKLEPRIANVLHRGMIEAATRSESVGLGQWLRSQNWHILSVYADAVMVKVQEDNNLPTLPEPWRCKATLNHLQFINSQAFISGEMTKLPGVSAELRKYSKIHRGEIEHGRIRHQPRSCVG